MRKKINYIVAAVICVAAFSFIPKPLPVSENIGSPQPLPDFKKPLFQGVTGTIVIVPYCRVIAYRYTAVGFSGATYYQWKEVSVNGVPTGGIFSTHGATLTDHGDSSCDLVEIELTAWTNSSMTTQVGTTETIYTDNCPIYDYPSENPEECPYTFSSKEEPYVLIPIDRRESPGMKISRK